ncbi:MAG: ABC transporter substrate-binding protein [Methanothrix sp.]|nr:ABC transporter substrate-binding protein [Methanothrix sp.]MDD4446298.1 ABC transporter substrate-binding protein [Methanothrix sp.]
MTTKELTISMLILASILFSGYIGGALAASEGDERISNLVIGSDMGDFAANLADFNCNYLMIFSHEGLVDFDSNGEIVPRLAESWDTDDMKKWVFHLVKNATWHDGVPFTSNDVKFTMEYTRDKKILYGSTAYNELESVETPDDHTVILNLKMPNIACLARLANVPIIIPEHIFENIDDPKKFTDVNQMFIGTGPYIFGSYDKAAGIINFKANDNYWAGKPAIKNIEMRLFKNQDTMMMALQNGEIDLPYFYSKGASYYYVPKLLENQNIKVMTFDSLGIKKAIIFNSQKKPFDSKDLRQAISYAINYDELLNLMTAGYGKVPNSGLVLESTKYYIETRPMEYDSEKARTMLDSLGYKDIDGDEFREMPDGSKFSPELLVQSSNDESVRASELIEKDLGEVGIALKIKMVDNPTFWDIIEEKREHEMMFGGLPFWTTNGYKGYYTSIMDSRNYGWANINDSAYQSIADNLAMAKDLSERKKLVETIQNYYSENLPVIPLYSMDFIQPYDKKYEGYATHPTWGFLSQTTFMNLHKSDG